MKMALNVLYCNTFTDEQAGIFFPIMQTHLLRDGRHDEIHVSLRVILTGGGGGERESYGAANFVALVKST
jgi:hypothetical protein